MLSVRLSSSERDLVEAASNEARTTLSDFVRRTVLEAAEMAVLERRTVVIPAKDWARFEQWAALPGRQIEALKSLMTRPPSWE